MKKVSIGGGQGFWGDSNDAAIHMVHKGNLNYMACDYLAELTLSIMERQKLKNSQAGYARDFIGLMDEIARESYEKKIRILTNAGGVNIPACVEELRKLAERKTYTATKSDMLPAMICWHRFRRCFGKASNSKTWTT